MQLAWFQPLVSLVKLLPPADFQLFEAHFPDKHTSVGCFGGSRPTGPVLELFRKPGVVRSSTQKTCTYIHVQKRNTMRVSFHAFTSGVCRAPAPATWMAGGPCQRASLLLQTGQSDGLQVSRRLDAASCKLFLRVVERKIEPTYVKLGAAYYGMCSVQRLKYTNR